MSSDQPWVIVARILRPQGRKGEVLAELLTDFPERFTTHPNVWLAPDGFLEGTASLSALNSLQPAEIVSHWLPVGRNAGRVVLHLQGIDTIDAAETLSGREVLVPLEDRVGLEDEDTRYISDLLGCMVYDGDTPLGRIEDVQFATTPDGSRRLEDAAPLLQIGGEHELLVPFAKAYLNSIDTEAKVVRMTLPEGLVGLNSALSQTKIPSD